MVVVKLTLVFIFIQINNKGRKMLDVFCKAMNFQASSKAFKVSTKMNKECEKREIYIKKRRQSRKS